MAGEHGVCSTQVEEAGHSQHHSGRQAMGFQPTTYQGKVFATAASSGSWCYWFKYGNALAIKQAHFKVLIQYNFIFYIWELGLWVLSLVILYPSTIFSLRNLKA